MKNIFAFLLLALLVVSCSQENFAPTTKTDQPFELSGGQLKTTPEPPVVVPTDFCKPSVVYNLVELDANIYGTVTVNNDDVNLYITIKAADGWLLWNVGYYAGSLANLPVDGTGEVDPQLFTKEQLMGSTNEISYSVPLSSLDPCFIVSVIAKVVQLDQAGNIITKAYPWTRDNLFAFSPEWNGGYGDYCKQVCEPPCYNEETAWSFGNSFKSLTGTARWGWYSVYTLGTPAEFDIFAGQTNNIGKLKVSDDGVNLTVKYETNGGVVMGLAHLYVGTTTDFKKYINKSGVPVPGQFPYVQSSDPYTSSFVFTIPLANVQQLNGQVIIAAHSESYLPCE